MLPETLLSWALPSSGCWDVIFVAGGSSALKQITNSLPPETLGVCIFSISVLSAFGFSPVVRSENLPFSPTERRRKGPRPAEPHRLQPVHSRPKGPDRGAQTRGGTRSPQPLLDCFIFKRVFVSFWLRPSQHFLGFNFRFCWRTEVLTTPRDFLCGDDVAHRPTDTFTNKLLTLRGREATEDHLRLA